MSKNKKIEDAEAQSIRRKSCKSVGFYSISRRMQGPRQKRRPKERAAGDVSQRRAPGQKAKTGSQRPRTRVLHPGERNEDDGRREAWRQTGRMGWRRRRAAGKTKKKLVFVVFEEAEREGQEQDI